MLLKSICKEVFVAQSCVTFADFVFVWQAMEDAVEEVGATSGHATWTSAMSAFMLSHLADLVASGLKTSKGFKKHFYNGCARAINEKFNTIRTGDQVKNHLKTWQKKWAKIIKLKKLSGALFDEDNCMITLDDEHYNGHVKVKLLLNSFVIRLIISYFDYKFSSIIGSQV